MTFQTLPTPDNSTDRQSQIRGHWGWFLAFGVVTAALGVVALSTVVLSTLTSVFLIGLFMIFAGAVEIVVGLRARSAGWKAMWIAVGFFYILSGILALAQPLLAATVFTLFIGAALLATGVVRIVAGVQMTEGSRAPVIVAGVVTTFLGLLIVLGWPASSLVVLGTFLGIDLLLYGLTWIAFALRLRGA